MFGWGQGCHLPGTQSATQHWRIGGARALRLYHGADARVTERTFYPALDVTDCQTIARVMGLTLHQVVTAATPQRCMRALGEALLRAA